MARRTNGCEECLKAKASVGYIGDQESKNQAIERIEAGLVRVG